MKKVFKYTFQGEREFSLDLPKGAQILKVDTDVDNEYCIWALVDPDAEKENRNFVIFMTGEGFIGDVNYIGTFFTMGKRLVCHLFEI